MRFVHHRCWLHGIAIFTIIASCSERVSDKELLFTLLSSSSTGIDFVNDVPESVEMNNLDYEYFYNGGGVAIGDINNDGLDDVYFSSNLFDNQLFINKGQLRFENITLKAGVRGKKGWATGVAMVDINHDGFLDIYVCRSGKFDEEKRRNELFINNGDSERLGQAPTFTERAKEFGLDFPGYSTQATFFDYDKDGDLDVFLLNHNVARIADQEVLRFRSQKNQLGGDRLFRNDDLRFVDVTTQSNIHSNGLGYGLGVSVGDLNNDSWPDLYVANDYLEQDYLYINNQDGTFTDHIKTATKHISHFSMGTDIADVNNDGLADVMALDMVSEDNYGIKSSMSGMNPEKFHRAVKNGFHYQYMTNTLQLNQGNLKFSEIAQLAGVSNTDWSWAPLFADFDNDGWKDLFITNGIRKDAKNNDFVQYSMSKFNQTRITSQSQYNVMLAEIIDQLPERKNHNYIYKNNGDLTFSKKVEAWGVDHPSFSNGVAYSDLDNDGDLDLVVNNIDQKAFVYRNNTVELGGGNYLSIQISGSPRNQFGIGVKLIITTESQVQTLEHYPVRGFQSSVTNRMHFGIGEDSMVKKLEAIWPDGHYLVKENIEANLIIQVEYRQAQIESDKSNNKTVNIIAGIAEKLGIDYHHMENEFDDFSRESLLPHKMSRLGPGLAVGDVNQDGLEDFFVGGAIGSSGKLFIQSEAGFVAAQTQPWQKDSLSEDMGASFFDLENDGDLDLYVVSGGSEYPEYDQRYADRIYLNDGEGMFEKASGILPRINSSGSRVVPADYDSDGDTDLFIAGRLVAGRYPYPASSQLLINDGKRLHEASPQIAPDFDKLGMVTDAIWADIDGDEDLDLITVGEWMPLKVFLNENGTLKADTNPLGLDYTGWWSSIQARDFDNDGDIDLVAGNLGLNYKYKASAEEPFHIYTTDFDDNQSVDIVLGYYNSGELYPLRGRECSSSEMPFLRNKFPTYNQFASALLTEVYPTEKLNQSLHYQADHFATSYFENTGNGRFEMKTLNSEAQFSSVNDMVVRDFNGDNYYDLLIAGNLYTSEVETIRNDASYGLFLLNDQKGGFEPMPLKNTGLYLEGDIKDIALIVTKKRGMSVLVGANNDQLQLFGLEEIFLPEAQYPTSQNRLTER